MEPTPFQTLMRGTSRAIASGQINAIYLSRLVDTVREESGVDLKAFTDLHEHSDLIPRAMEIMKTDGVAIC